MFQRDQLILVYQGQRQIYIERIFHECPCIIELIRRVGEKDKMRGFVELLFII